MVPVPRFVKCFKTIFKGERCILLHRRKKWPTEVRNGFPDTKIHIKDTLDLAAAIYDINSLGKMEIWSIVSLESYFLKKNTPGIT